VKSRVLCRSSALVYASCTGKQKSPAAAVWQQLFEQQDITVIYTIHFHPWLHETTPVQQSLETPAETDMHAHVYQ